MSITFVLIVVVMVIITLLSPKDSDKKQPIEIDVHLFKVSPAFAVGSLIIVGILAGLYASFW